MEGVEVVARVNGGGKMEEYEEMRKKGTTWRNEEIRNNETKYKGKGREERENENE